MWKSKIHRVWLSIVLASFALLLFEVQAWCRLMNPSSMADVRQLAERAPLVFRGRVLTVIPTTINTEPGASFESIAKIQVDRWYRGKGTTEASLRFAYGGFAANGHDCFELGASCQKMRCSPAVRGNAFW
jgi:hypothetical protein